MFMPIHSHILKVTDIVRSANSTIRAIRKGWVKFKEKDRDGERENDL